MIEAERARKKAEFAHELAEEKRKEAEAAKEEADLLVDSTDDEIRDLTTQIEKLTKANERLVAENFGLRDKLNSMDAVPLLQFGQEDEFFPGEIKEMVLCVLEDALEGFGDKKARRADVLKDIIKTNECERKIKSRTNALWQRMKNYQSMDASTRAFLQGLGFAISGDGKHYKLTYFGDARYNTSLPKTGSDYREGRNIVAQIIHDMF